ncbi:MAG: bacillithiol biosynthesis protein BshC, partial [Planctomycetota bacterium]
WLQSQAPLAGEGLGAWLCRLLTALFAGSPLLCVEAHRLRPLWTQRRTVICQAWPAAALEGRRQAVIAAGHSDALGAVPVPPLFRDSPAGRSPLPDASRTPCPPEELSSGAALRPVIQQAVLPAAVAVLGPGELGYHALLGPAYEALAVPMPAFVPRQGGALVDARLQRACRRWGVDPAGLRVDTPAPALPAPAHGVDLAELDAAIAALDRAEEGVQGARLRSGVVRLRRERDRLAASQERVLSLSQAIWRYGPGIAAHLIAAADADQPHRRRVLPI